MRYTILVFLLGLQAANICIAEDVPSGVWNRTDVDILRKELLAGYDPNARPAPHNVATHVSASLRINSVDIEEHYSSIVVYGWLKLTWDDPKLSWTPSNHSNIESLHIRPCEIWSPDVVLYNSISRETHLMSPYMIVYSSGKVLSVPPIRFKAICNMNYKYWPRDVQNCMLVLGSWTYHAFALNLTFDDKAFDNDDNVNFQEGHWKLKAVKAEHQTKFYPCCAEPYPSINYEVTVERKANVNAILHEISIAALSLLLVSSALRPPNSRLILLGLVAGLTLMHLLVICTKSLPNIHGSPPRIVLLLLGILGVTVVWSLCSVLVDSLGKGGKPVPGSLKRFLKDSKKKSVIDEEVKMNDDMNSKSTTAACDNDCEHEWSKLGILIDRISTILGIVGLVAVVAFSL